MKTHLVMVFLLVVLRQHRTSSGKRQRHREGLCMMFVSVWSCPFFLYSHWDLISGPLFPMSKKKSRTVTAKLSEFSCFLWHVCHRFTATGLEGTT